MGYSWIKLTQDEFGRKGVKQNFALALIVMMFAGVFAFILPAPATADSWTDTTTENFALGTHENTENVSDNVRLENIGVGIYYTQGRFTSQAFDAGQVVENWDNISWTVTTPSLTKQENDNVGAEPPTLIDGDSRIGVVQAGTSYEDTRDNDGVYENIQESNLGALTTMQENAALTVVVSGDNLSTPDKLNADDGDNYRVDAAYTPVDEDNLVENGYFTNNPAASGWENTVTNISGNDVGRALWDSGGGFVSGHALGRSEDWSILWYQDFSATANPGSATLKFAWRPAVVVMPQEAHIKVILKSPSAVETTIWTKDYDSNATPYTAWTLQENDMTSIINENGTWRIILQSDLYTASDPNGEWRWDWDNITLEAQTGGTYAVEVQHDSATFSIPAESTIENVRVRLNIGSDNTATYTLQIRDWQNSEWDNLETVAINSGTEYMFDNTLTVNPKDYISATDNIRVRLFTAPIENDHIVHEDYLVYEVNYTPTDHALRWEHRIENVAAGHDNYWVRVRGYTSGDSEKVGVYIWDNNASSWEFLDNLTTTEKTITKQIAGSNINQYLRDDDLSVKYEDYDNTNDNQTTVHIDLCIVQAERVYTTEMKFQVATSADDIVWSDSFGPDGTTLTYFTTSPTSLGNIGDNRYFRYIAYFSTENNMITLVLHDVTINYTLVPPPDAPTLYLPADNTHTSDNTVYFEWSSIAGAENYDLFVDDDSDFFSPEVSVTITENYYTSSPLTDESYSWRVRARGSVNNVSDNSATWTFVITTLPPSAPTPYLPAGGTVTSDNTVYFEWSSIASAENYDLFVDNDSDFSSPEVSVTVTDNYYTSSALPNENYSWKVIAVNMNGQNGSSTRAFVIDTIAPAAPTLVSPENNNTVKNALTQTFTWTEPEAGVTYDIQIDNETSFTSPYVHENTGLADNSYIYTFASDGVYYWRVRAVDLANNQSSWADYFKLKIQAPPGQPTLYLPADGTHTNDNTPYFEWTISANTDNHRLLVDNDLDFSSPEENVLFGATDNTYTISAPGLADENYSWKVIAINADGENESSTWTFVIDTIDPSIPTPHLPADEASTDDNTVYFEWSSIAGAEYYDLFVDNDPDFSSPEVSVRVTDNYYTSSALPDGSYSWRVRARDAANNVSDNSVTRTFLIDTTTPTTSTPVSSGGAVVESDLTTLETLPLPSQGALTVTMGAITAGGIGSADFTRYAIAVTGVRITTTSDVSGARVDVVMHAAKPAGAAEIASPVYTYFDLSTTVGASYIGGAAIKFEVPRSWIAEMDIDEGTIRLLRYRGGWQRLSTRMVGADFTYLYYEATTSGFSLFAIAGESMVTPTPTPWDTPTVPPPTQSPPFIYAALFTMAGVVGLAVTYRLARPSRYYVMLKRLKQLERELIRQRVRHIGLPLPEPPARVPGQVSPAELEALRRLEQIGQEKQLRERRS